MDRRIVWLLTLLVILVLVGAQCGAPAAPEAAPAKEEAPAQEAAAKA